MIRSYIFASVLLVAATNGAFAASAACNAIDAANKKLALTPFHSVTEMGGRHSESVVTGGSRYIQIGKKWMKRPFDASDITSASTPTATCATAGSDQVDGEAASVFTVHNATPDGTADMKYWISTSRGLPLKTETALTVPGGAKQQISVKYDYNNIRAPI
ncbi:MAG TPA: hypothetical protein VGM26_11380 [Rhizomicrobium sp.]|jgi:hypothetical protein